MYAVTTRAINTDHNYVSYSLEASISDGFGNHIWTRVIDLKFVVSGVKINKHYYGEENLPDTVLPDSPAVDKRNIRRRTISLPKGWCNQLHCKEHLDLLQGEFP